MNAIALVGVMVFGQINGSGLATLNEYGSQEWARARALARSVQNERDWEEAQKLGVTVQMLEQQRRQYRLTTRSTVSKKIDANTVILKTDSLLRVPDDSDLELAKRSGKAPTQLVPINWIWKHPNNPKTQAQEEIVLRLLPDGATNGHIFTNIKSLMFAYDGWVEMDGKRLRVMKCVPSTRRDSK